ncbi:MULTISPECIES: FecR family protein [Butyricimonas]|uniref:FecR family protein n=1 Tax=Butyricimonas TaxID=574697 RepID=UPI0020897A0B|nr:FecR family protein [Butyricimonas paravirosa]BDF56598.1 iron dicitrate transporter FecR [Odoribacteraceae bacterium]GKH95462.1 iron dicitrate transporter FecR [Odoribacteraceae bacterium]GKH98086.1 iron dicitrate transporter FecR [Odoribacteraceae bacterium]GKI01120.1 iron dicitrate transporter FecR [Odoribacteraceae bacterium]
MEDKSIFELIAEYSAGTISPADAELLRERLESDAEAMRLFREIRETEKILKSVQAQEKIDLQKSWQRLDSSLVGRSRKGWWLFWTVGSVVAASVALLLMFVFPFTRQVEQPETLVSQVGITPGGVKAVLQYEDGKTIDLTSSSSRIVISDGLVLVNDSLKGLRFDQGELENRPMKYHTLTVPVGGEYHFTLADGTRVWVNSASEVRFPNCFSGERREIYVKGEVYLEVARDEKHPFIVYTGENEVRVLGTRFNLTAYPDEQKVITTLVEGSVEFRNDQSSVRLKPGEQSVLNRATNKLEKQKVDVSIYTSWVSGTYEYERSPLSDITRQLSRWYDVQFIYESTEFSNHPFTGVVKRDQSLEEVLSIIEKTTNIRFKISGRTIIIKRAVDAANISRSSN